MKIFDDSNFEELIGDGSTIVVNGVHRMLSRTPKPMGHDTRKYSAKFGDRIPLIPRSEWPDRIAEQKAKKMRVSDHQRFEATNQGNLPTCWAAGTCHTFTTMRAMQGLSPIMLSPCSLAVPISGGHSGGYEGDAVEYFTKHGGVRESLWGATDTSRRLMNDAACVADRELFIAEETLELEGFDQFATAWLLGFPTVDAYDFWSHVVMGADLLELERGSFGTLQRNNWGHWGEKNDAGFDGYLVMREGKGTPSSGFMFRQVSSSAA